MKKNLIKFKPKSNMEILKFRFTKIKVNTKQTSIILLLLIFIFLLFTVYSQKTTPNPNTIFIHIEQMNETNAISKNPDFNYEREEWPHEWGARIDELPESFWEPWKGEFLYLKEAAGRKGVIVIHPISENEPSFIEQRVSLPPGKFILRATIADIAYDIDKILGSYTYCSYADVIFKIKIIYGDQEETIWETIKNTNEGWVEVVLDISKFANKDITMRIESYAGGLSPWCGEWAAVDKFYVIQAIKN